MTDTVTVTPHGTGCRVTVRRGDRALSSLWAGGVPLPDGLRAVIVRKLGEALDHAEIIALGCDRQHDHAAAFVCARMVDGRLVTWRSPRPDAPGDYSDAGEDE